LRRANYTKNKGVAIARARKEHEEQALQSHERHTAIEARKVHEAKRRCTSAQSTRGTKALQSHERAKYTRNKGVAIARARKVHEEQGVANARARKEHDIDEQAMNLKPTDNVCHPKQSSSSWQALMRHAALIYFTFCFCYCKKNFQNFY